MSEHFCYVALHADHVNLGFNHGAALPDPDGLLEGTGAQFRHVKIHDASDVDRAGVTELIEAAVEERRTALEAED